MAVKVVRGNLLRATEDIIGHQVNCQGVMGTTGNGVAKQIREEWPIVYYEYKDFLAKQKDKSQALGLCQFVNISVSPRKYVANMFAQFDINKGFLRKKMTNEEMLKCCLYCLKEFASRNGLSVALPYKIGCDRGGADWYVVEQIIEEIFSDYDITLYKY